MDDPETWRWIWLAGAVVLAIGEIATTRFLLLPFAIGALAGAALAFAGVHVGWQLVAFAAASAIVFAATRPLAHRVDRKGDDEHPDPSRLLGRSATVIEDISAAGVGMIQVDDEQWWAQNVDAAPLRLGDRVIVRQIEGTRALVELAPDPDSS